MLFNGINAWFLILIAKEFLNSLELEITLSTFSGATLSTGTKIREPILISLRFLFDAGL